MEPREAALPRQRFHGESLGLNRGPPGRGGIQAEGVIWLNRGGGLKATGRRLQGVIAGDETQHPRALNATVRAMFREPGLALGVVLVL